MDPARFGLCYLQVILFIITGIYLLIYNITFNCECNEHIDATCDCYNWFYYIMGTIWAICLVWIFMSGCFLMIIDNINKIRDGYKKIK